MTVYSAALRTTHIDRAPGRKGTRKVPFTLGWNLALIGALVSAFLAYIVLSILFASSQYALTSKRSEYRRVNTTYAVTQAKTQDSKSINDLVSFSRRSGMIETSKETPIVMYAKDNGVAFESNPLQN
ncbi:MAG TPA: hypothetical protein VJK50_00870 [Patescibacteria group bacterium]|nr:hypothetical protein [Patescibacteria group bacterium]